jgi:prefoldin subunit 5
VPGLDFSNLKQVKDYKDWYAYAKKLEDALTLLRARIKLLEDENLDLTAKLEKTLQQSEQLH